MALRLTVTLTQEPDDLLAMYGAGAKVYLDSSATRDGVYANVSSTTILAGTTFYEFTDVSGTSTTWYKSRPGDTGGTSYGAYSDPFQGTSVAAYATLMELRQSMDLPGTGRDAFLLGLLEDASAMVDQACHRRFVRYPQVSGTATVYVDIARASDSLALAAPGGVTVDGLALDIISITTLKVRESETSAYVAIAAGDTGYYLDAGDSLGQAGVDWPWHDVILSPAGTYTTFPTGYRAVEITGVLGFPVIPGLVRRATVDIARDLYRQGPGGGPQLGVNQFNVPIFAAGMPDTFRRLTAPGSPYVRTSWAAV